MQQQMSILDDFSYFIQYQQQPTLESNLSLQQLEDDYQGHSNLLKQFSTIKDQPMVECQNCNSQLFLMSAQSSNVNEICAYNRPEFYLLPYQSNNSAEKPLVTSPLQIPANNNFLGLELCQTGQLFNNNNQTVDEEDIDYDLEKYHTSQNQSTSEFNNLEIHLSKQSINQKDDGVDDQSIDRFFEDFLQKNHSKKHSQKSANEELSAEELRRRKNQKIRKSKEVYKTFEFHYHKDSNWSRALIDKLALELKLTPQQVYKWNWDKKKRDRKKALKAKLLKKTTKTK